MVLRAELRKSWRVLLGTILVYLMCYPGTVLLVVPGLSNVAENPNQLCLAVIIFTIFMNTAGFSVSPLLKVVSHRGVAVISTLLQVVGLVICALTVTGHFCWTLLGFGVMVGSGVGITFINNIVICHKTFPKSLTLVFAIALSSICFIGSAVPEVLKVLRDCGKSETKPSLNITNTTNIARIYPEPLPAGGSDDERKNQLLVYTGLTCVGFIGALLLKPPKETAAEVEELSNLQDQNVERGGNGESQRKVNLVKDQMKALLCDPKFLFIALLNSCCFSVSVYLHTLGPQIHESTLTTLWNIREEDESLKRSSEDQKIILKTIFIATNALGYMLFCFAGYRFPQKKTFLYQVAVGFISLNILMVCFISRESETTVMALLVIFTMVSALGFAGVLMMSNLLYQDHYAEVFPAAVNLSNLMRGFFALLIYPFRELVTDFYQQLYMFSGVMITLIILWFFVEVLFRSKKERVLL